jgi:tetratricopeptide (TPR) repeat protein
MTPDPYAPYLRQAEDLIAQGEIVKAGQIWQAILKQQPAHTEARERLLALKAQLEAQREAERTAQAPVAAPAPEPEPVSHQAPSPSPDPEHLLREGCTLYDMGQVEDARQKWEQVLALDPHHRLARGYADGARRELGLAPLAPTLAAAPEIPLASPDEDVAKVLREAVQLYDMGLTEEAILKWERALELAPERVEIHEYLRQARLEVTHISPVPAPPPPPAPQPAPAASAHRAAAEAATLDLKLRQGDHLLSLQRHEEAAFTFQQALAMAPGDPRALHGLNRCRRPAGQARTPQAAPAPPEPEGRIYMVEEASPLDLQASEGVAPPAALTRAAPAPRQGLALPERFQDAAHHLPWLKEPRVWAIAAGGLVVLGATFAFIHSYRKDRQLADARQAARAEAMAAVALKARAVDLAEPPSALRDEVETALVTDPLRAFLRAQTLVNQHPGEGAGPRLLEKAREGLAGGLTGASLAEFQKHVKNGDLEAAAKVIDTLLRATPDDADLRLRAGRLHLALCAAHAAQTKWDEAQDDLLRGRALFPADKTWQARLKLLERVKALPKNQQAAWLPLLG